MMIKRSPGGESAGGGRWTLKSTCVVPSRTLTSENVYFGACASLWSHQLTSDSKISLLFWKYWQRPCLKAVSVPPFVIGGLRGSTATSGSCYTFHWQPSWYESIVKRQISCAAHFMNHDNSCVVNTNFVIWGQTLIIHHRVKHTAISRSMTTQSTQFPILSSMFQCRLKNCCPRDWVIISLALGWANQLLKKQLKDAIGRCFKVFRLLSIVISGDEGHKACCSFPIKRSNNLLMQCFPFLVYPTGQGARSSHR